MSPAPQSMTSLERWCNVKLYVFNRPVPLSSRSVCRVVVAAEWLLTANRKLYALLGHDQASQFRLTRAVNAPNWQREGVVSIKREGL